MFYLRIQRRREKLRRSFVGEESTFTCLLSQQAKVGILYVISKSIETRYGLFAGSEADFVILSTVRSLPRNEILEYPSRSWVTEHLGFVTDQHQINVALTRAKHGLFIVGMVLCF